MKEEIKQVLAFAASPAVLSPAPMMVGMWMGNPLVFLYNTWRAEEVRQAKANGTYNPKPIKYAPCSIDEAWDKLHAPGGKYYTGEGPRRW